MTRLSALELLICRPLGVGARLYQLTTIRRVSIPGEMLRDEVLPEYGLSQNQLAKATGISPKPIAEILNHHRQITADTPLRLGLYFGNTQKIRLNLQTHYDLNMASKNLVPEAVARTKAQRAA